MIDKFLLFEYCITCYEITLFIFWCNKFLEKRYEKRITIILTLLFSIIFSGVVTYLNVVNIYNAKNLVISMLIILIINNILYKNNVLVKITFSGIYIALNLIIDFIIITLFSMILSNDCLLYQFGLLRIIAALISKVILTIIILAICIRLNKIKEEYQYDFWLSLAILIVSVIVISFLLIIETNNKKNYRVEIIILLSYLFLLLLIFISLIFMKKFIKKQNDLKDYLLVSVKNSMLEKLLQENEYALERWKKEQHDFKHNLLYMQELVEEKKYSELQTYIDRQLTCVNKACTMLKTGNHMLDIIINYYENQIKENNIHFSVNIELPPFFEMEDVDLCAFLGNMLENAFEAVKKCNENREVWLFIKSIGEMTVFKCQNYFSKDILLKEGNIETIKNDKFHHGIGLKSIKKIVEKYNASIKISFEKNIFCLIVMFGKE